MKVISADQMRLIDAETIEKHTPSLELMERAGVACSEEILKFTRKFPPHHVKRLVVVCGSGNNGGDGFVIARHLRNDFNIKIFCTHDIENISQDAQAMAKQVLDLCEFNSIPKLNTGEIVVDCLLGTGLCREVKGRYADIITEINNSQTPVIAIDIPSGINGNTGEAMGQAIRARLTLSIGLPKIAYFKNDGPKHIGALRNLDIGFPEDITDKHPAIIESYFAEDAQKQLSKLKWNSHKYTRGQCLVIGGSPNYSGAPIIAAEAAAVSGAGMIVLARPGLRFPQNTGIVCLNHPDSNCTNTHELESFIPKSKSILIGPGMEINAITRKLFSKLLHSGKNLVVDASAIDLIPENLDIFPLQSSLVITPHEGELKRLAESLKINQNTALETAQAIASKLQIYVILKGPQSKVISPEGRISYNSSGCPALSCAGSGDALAGILVSLLAQANAKDNFFSQLQLGTFIHGLSAETFHGPMQCFTPNDFPKYISLALADLSSKLM